jgi:hypothetical protein
MNASAKAHLAKAKEYVAKGEQFYRMAAEQIVAAQAEDSTLSNREIGEWFGRSHTWVQDIVRWHTSGSARTPFGEDARPGMRERTDRSATKKVLRESSPEEIAELLDDRDIRVNVAKAQDLVGKNREQTSRDKEREILGDETVDNLNYRQALEHLTGLLLSAHGSVEGFVRRVRIDGTDIDGAPESWKNYSLELVDEVEADLGMVRLLIEGGTVTDDDITELLSREVS